MFFFIFIYFKIQYMNTVELKIHELNENNNENNINYLKNYLLNKKPIGYKYTKGSDTLFYTNIYEIEKYFIYVDKFIDLNNINFNNMNIKINNLEKNIYNNNKISLSFLNKFYYLEKKNLNIKNYLIKKINYLEKLNFYLKKIFISNLILIFNFSIIFVSIYYLGVKNVFNDIILFIYNTFYLIYFITYNYLIIILLILLFLQKIFKIF